MDALGNGDGLVELRAPEPGVRKTLHLVDATYRLPAGGAVDVLADPGRLTEVAAEAVTNGGGQVLDTSHVVFPNGAITLVLILAESHLAVHTWPEEQLVAIDLFSCGSIDGTAVLGELAGALHLDQPTVHEIPRG